MSGSIEFIAVALGALAGGLVVWLMLRNRITELHGENKSHTEECDTLHERLRVETEKRATAEGQATRLPELEKSIHKGEETLAACQAECTILKTKLSEVETLLSEERKQTAEKITLLTETKEQLKLEFQNIANKIFEDKGQKFTTENKKNLDMVLSPVREQLSDFKKKIEDVYDKESKERVSLLSEITHLKTLNQQISEDAVNLTNALKGQSQTQGAWGEVILERILEESGLRKGREYETQSSFTTEKGRQRRSLQSRVFGSWSSRPP